MTSQAPRTLGFLFADLRGYSAFVETHGDDAGAQLLGAYRDLVRKQVARFDGAEIRTEGDSFYVVFPSASSAVQCGLAILEAASTSSAAGGGPIRVGIGVHAGETTQTDEGYVGSAVNIAARVCAVARPGEMLVTGTVQSLIRTRLPVRFLPRGNPRLKGIRQRLDVFRVEAVAALADGTVPRIGRRPIRERLALQPALIGITAAAAVAIFIGVAVVAAFRPEDNDGSDTGLLAPTARLSEAPSPRPTAAGFPSAEEEVVLRQLSDATQATCERSPQIARPRYVDGSIDPTGPRRHLEVVEPLAEIRCFPTRADRRAPSQLMLWTAAFPEEVGLVMLQLSLQEEIPNGECAEGAPATGWWAFGESTGRMICYSSEVGDAELWWSAAGDRLLARATREDGNHGLLYAWWQTEGRFLEP